MNAPTTYAVYKGDGFLDVGTARELSARRGISVNATCSMASRSNGKDGDGRLVVDGGGR